MSRGATGEPFIGLLVEGMVDEAVGRRLVARCGGHVAVVYGRRGAGYIRRRLRGFAQSSSELRPLVALVDFMDTGRDCPPGVRDEWLGPGFQTVALNVVVRELESWLLADNRGIASFFRVPLHRVPKDPERLDDPKESLVNLVRHHSRSRALVEAVVPGTGLTAMVGPGYNEELVRFAAEAWNMEAAAAHAPSLSGAVVRVQRLLSGASRS